MEVESLAGLKAVFEDWRSKKRYDREAVPAELRKMARDAARIHGAMAVWRVTKLDRRHLKVERRRRTRKASSGGPGYSRLDVEARTAVARPFAEVETATGLKVRLFAQTEEMVEMLSLLCSGGAS